MGEYKASVEVVIQQEGSLRKAFSIKRVFGAPNAGFEIWAEGKSGCSFSQVQEPSGTSRRKLIFQGWRGDSPLDNIQVLLLRLSFFSKTEAQVLG